MFRAHPLGTEVKQSDLFLMQPLSSCGESRSATTIHQELESQPSIQTMNVGSTGSMSPSLVLTEKKIENVVKS